MSLKERIKEHWLIALWNKVSKEIIRVLKEYNVKDIRKYAEQDYDLLEPILNNYGEDVKYFKNELRKMGLRPTKEDLKKATAYIIYFLRANGYECDGVVIKWIYKNVRKIVEYVLVPISS